MAWQGGPTACIVVLGALSAVLAHAHAPSIALNKKYLNFVATPGVNPPAQSVTLTNATHGRMPWTAAASTASGGNWLSITPASGSLPGIDPSLEWAYITVVATSSGMRAGVYYGTVTVMAPGDATTPPADNTPQIIQVALTIGTGAVAPAPGIGLSTGSIELDAVTGRATTGVVQITNTGGGTLNWTAVTESFGGGNWLGVSPAFGSNSGSFVVTANASALKLGTYAGQVSISAIGAANSPQTISVTLRVRAPAAPTLQLSTADLSFSVEVGAANPPPQTLEVFNSGDGALSWRLDTTTFNGGAWLAVTPGSGAAPGSFSVSADTSKLSAGYYAGRITVVSDGAGNSPLQVPVALTVRGPQPVFDQRGVVSAATFLTSFLAPGEIISIFGSRLGPRDKVSFTLDAASQKLPTTLGGTRVTFDGVPAPLFFVSYGQLNLQVPFEVVGQISTRMAISVEGLDPAEAVVPLQDAAPGVFTLDGTRAAALNQDLSVNSAANPAAPGSIIQLFVTGQGVFDPPLETGALAPASPPFPQVALPVQVTMDGMDARVLFAGAAPGFAGLAQLNVEVPSNLHPSDQVTVWVLVGSKPSGKRAAIAVR